MTNVVGVIKLRQHMAEYIRRAEQGEAFVIVRNNEAVARLVPAREEPMSEEPTPETYADIDDERRAVFIEMTPARLRQLVGNDKLEALRILNEMEAALLANGGQP